jgi:hypothetical protein
MVMVMIVVVMVGSDVVAGFDVMGHFVGVFVVVGDLVVVVIVVDLVVVVCFDVVVVGPLSHGVITHCEYQGLPQPSESIRRRHIIVNMKVLTFFRRYSMLRSSDIW